MNVSQRELTVFLKNNGARRARKFTTHFYRIAEKPEQVETIINGQKETGNTALPGDYIVEGLVGEKYVVRPDTFSKRYEILEPGLANAIGSGWAIQWSGPEFTFTAPWGEEMTCLPGDYLMSPNEDLTEVYRIEQQQFNNTYKFV